MTKEVAKKIVRGITDKIECNTVDIDDWAEFWGFTREEYEEFLDMAIKAPEQEPCGDCISRQAAIDEAFEVDTKEYGRIEVVGVDAINSLLPVTPQAKTGHWIKGKYRDDDIRYNDSSYKCDKCGAKMIEPQESEEIWE